MEQEDYTVQLQGDNRNYDQAMAGSVQQTDSLTASLARLSAGIGSLYQRADRKLSIISATEAATITGVTLAAGRLEQQMSQLQARQTMLNQTSGAYLQTVNNTRRAWGLQSQDAINLVQQLNRLSVPLTQQQQTINQYVRLSATTGEQINGLAQANTMFMRQMDAAPRTVDRYSSMIGQLNAQLGVSAQGTLDFSNQIAPLSRTLGMSAQQIAGIGAAFSKSGQDGYAAANVYTKILSDVNRAIQYGSPEVQIYSDMLGKTVDQFKAMPKAEVITEIFERLNQQGPQAIKTLERLGLEGVRSQRAIQAVVQQGGLRSAIDVAQSGYSNTGGFTSASQKALDGLQDTLGKMGETLKTFAQSVGGVFLPAANVFARGANVMLSPLRMLSDVLDGLPGPLKTLLASAGALAVLAPLIPKLAMGLAATSIVPQLIRGPLAQGAMLGMNPNRDPTRPMRTYMEGGGTAGRRALFAAGMRGGAFLSGNSGNLGGLNFVDPDTGEEVDSRTWAQRAGGMRYGASSWVAGHLGEEGRADLRSRMSNLSLRGGARAVGRAGVQGLGILARASLNPWAPSYLHDSMRGTPDDITQDSSFRRHFTQEGLDANAKEIKAHSRAVSDARKLFTDSSMGFNNALKNNTSVLRTMGSEIGKTGLATARGAAGVAYGGGMLAGRAGLAVGRRVGGAVADFAGGPVGMAVIGGTAAYGLYDRNKKDRLETATDNGQDDSAGAAYRDALGIASKATTTFANVVEDNASRMSSVVATMQQAITVTAADIKKATGATAYTDKNVSSMNYNEAKTYAAAMIPGAQPQEAALLKGDLIKRFGSSQAQEILNYGSKQSNAGQGTFGLISERGQNLFGQDWLANNIYATDETKSRAGMVSDTMKNQLNLVYGKEGAKGASRYQQSQLNSFLDQVYTQGKGQSGSAKDSNFTLSLMKGGSQVTRQQYFALSQALGLDPNDKDSMNAMDKVLADIQRLPANASDAERQTAYQTSLTKNLANTDIGSKLAQARNMGGIYSGTSYLVTQPQSKPLDVLGNSTIRDIRGGASAYDRYGSFKGITGGVNIAGQVATQYGYRGAASSVSTALNNEGNTDLQAQAVRDLITKTNAGQMGDWNQTAAAMMELKNNAGAASSQLSQLASAALAAAQNERTYQMGMQGKTTFVDTARTAMSDFNAAQGAYKRNPTADGAYQRVEDTRAGAQAALTAGKERMVQVAMQYRQLNIQRQQGEDELNRQQGYAQQDYQRSRMYAEEDFQRSRSRAEESFSRQQDRALSDYHIQRSRAEHDYELQRSRAQADFTQQRGRQEEDYNHSVVVMAEQTARSVYDTYQRVTVQRSWSGTNLLTNLNDQNSRLGQQNADLAKARKLGLSNQTISQLGLNESQNAQQLARLVQDMMEDPKLAKQYNDSIKKRLAGSTKLMKDAANQQWTETQRAQKLAMDRASEDFKKSMGRNEKDFSTAMSRQEKDTNKSFSRAREDFDIQLSQGEQDFGIQRDRSAEAMQISFERQRKDFAHQMAINAANISTFAQDIGMSFEQAFSIVHSNVQGETKHQFESLKKLYDSYNTQVNDKNLGLYKAINEPYKELSAYQPFSSSAMGKKVRTTVPGQTSGGIPTGGPGEDSDEAFASALGGGEHAHLGGSSTGGASPLRGSMGITAPFGAKGHWASGSHSGMDLRASEGAPIFSSGAGKVIFSGAAGAYGNLTKIAHGDGVETWYAHQNASHVHGGDEVEAGQQIGSVGHTGRTFPAGPAGAHLHVEMRVNGKATDPSGWLGGSVSSGGIGGPDLSVMPDWDQMKGVKDWNSTLNSLGIFKRPGLTKDTLGTMAGLDYLAMFEKKYPNGLPGSGSGSNAGGLSDPTKVSNPRGLTTYHGGTFTRLFVANLKAAEREAKKNFSIFQGGFRPSSSFSGSTHNMDAIDAHVDYTLLRAFRHRVGAMGDRTGKGNWAPHMHGVPAPGHGYPSPSALAQYWNYLSLGGASQSLTSNFGLHGSGGSYSKPKGYGSGGGGGGHYSGSNQSIGHQMMIAMGWGESNWPSLRSLWNGESGWNEKARNPSSGAYGIPQSLPASKMSSAGSDWRTNAATQIKWGLNYIKGVYGSPSHAYSRWLGRHPHWYQSGTDMAGPGWAMVGENGPEMLQLRGGERIRNSEATRQAITASKAQQIVHTNSAATNNHWDQSMHYEGQIIVMASDPNELGRKLAEQRRLSALVSRRG